MNELYHNFLLIDKPAGWTSFDVVNYIRNRIRKSVNQDYPNIRKLKVGHAGTLDPFATGLLIVGIGREATKKLDEFKNLPKTYIATLKLGYVSDTFDKTGNILPLKKGGIRPARQYLALVGGGMLSKFLANIPPRPPFSRGVIEKVLKKFVGKQKQLPPMFSAKKVKGKRLYELARKGIEIKRKKNKIEIYNIKLIDYVPSPLQGEGQGEVKLEVTCSSGTYIRTLAHDIGKKLGCGAYCEELQRTKIGDFDLSTAENLFSWQNSDLDKKTYLNYTDTSIKY